MRVLGTFRAKSPGSLLSRRGADTRVCASCLSPGTAAAASGLLSVLPRGPLWEVGVVGLTSVGRGRQSPVCEAGPLPALRGGSGVRPPRRKVTVSLASVPVDLTPPAGRLCLAGLPGL